LNKRHVEWRVKYAHIADGIESEIRNLEKLASGKEFKGLELKAVGY